MSQFKSIIHDNYLISFDAYPVDGFQFRVSLMDGDDFIELRNTRMVGYTWFQALAQFTAEYYDDADTELATTIAFENGIEWGYEYDAECTECGQGDYEENMEHDATYSAWSHKECPCDHTQYSTSPRVCDDHTDSDTCYQRTCDNCNRVVAHELETL
jgi:hypothetical protein